MVELSGGETTISTAELHRLRQIESAADKIWPAIRFWGLCGAEPHYAEAAFEIGRLIGKLQPQQQVGTETIAATRMETVRAISEWAKESPEVMGLMGRGNREKLAKMIGELGRP